MPVMRNAGGYVRVYRSLAEWEWYQDDRCVRLFLHLLIKSNWTEGNWRGNPIEPGQIITSSVKLAEQLGWTRSAVVRTLEKLKSTGELDTQSNNHWTLVTLANWEKYQGDGPEADNKPRNKRTTTGQPMRQPPDTIEEGKEGKKENTEERKSAALVWPSWASDITRTAWERWKAYKAEQGDKYKPIGEQAALSKVAKEYTNDSDFVSAIEHSMANGWKGIFKPRNAPVLNIGGGMTKEQADEEMRQIRIKYGRDPVMGWVGDEECSRPLLIYMGRIKEHRTA